MSLRVRLLLTYFFVIVTCIAVIAVALFLLLRGAPVQKRLIEVRLADEAAVVQRLIRIPLQSNATPEQIMRRLVALSASPLSRILFIDDQTGRILADSENELTARNLFELGQPQRGDTGFAGEFELNGEHWLYSSRPAPDRPRPAIEVVALAQFDPAPTFNDPIFRELVQPLLIAGLLAFGVSIILALVVTRSVTRPLQHVAKAADRIAAGDYDQAVPIEGPSEVRDVAINFNQMAQKVRDSQQIQRDFLANISHELKTPLTSIQGFAQAIKDGAASEPEAIRKSATIIYDEANRMGRMVAELLDLARIETGQIVMRREAVKIDQIVKSVVEKMMLRAQHNSIALIGEIPDGLPDIMGDGDRLAQVFGNLIDNALKHTPSGGKVTVSVRAMSGSSVVKKGKPWPGGIEVSVADTGSGISPEDLSRIFERFYQVDKSRARAKSGASLGLGLAIAKEIVTAHGGTIHAESVVGLGTRFVVTLPIERGKVA
jgi:signal transduction histidine kinase